MSVHQHAIMRLHRNVRAAVVLRAPDQLAHLPDAGRQPAQRPQHHRLVAPESARPALRRRAVDADIGHPRASTRPSTASSAAPAREELQPSIALRLTSRSPRSSLPFVPAQSGRAHHRRTPQSRAKTRGSIALNAASLMPASSRSTSAPAFSSKQLHRPPAEVHEHALDFRPELPLHAGRARTWTRRGSARGRNQQIEPDPLAAERHPAASYRQKSICVWLPSAASRSAPSPAPPPTSSRRQISHRPLDRAPG